MNYFLGNDKTRSNTFLIKRIRKKFQIKAILSAIVSLGKSLNFIKLKIDLRALRQS